MERITAPQLLQRIQEIPPPRPDAVQVSTADYYNKVYKSARVRTPQTMPARRLAIWHRSAVRAYPVSLAPFTRRDSPPGGAEPLAALAVFIFGLSPDS